MLMTSYRDLSQETPDPLLDTMLCNRQGQRGDKNCYFPLKLHKMISKGKIGGFANVVSWQVHGRSFIIHDEHKFFKQILPL